MGNLAFAYLAAGLGLLGAALGAGIGIGRLASSGLEGIARQPEAVNDIRGTAIILAAGRGSRLDPQHGSTDFSKPLIKLGGVSLLERTVDNCRAAGAKRQGRSGHSR